MRSWNGFVNLLVEDKWFYLFLSRRSGGMIMYLSEDLGKIFMLKNMLFLWKECWELDFCMIGLLKLD